MPEPGHQNPESRPGAGGSLDSGVVFGIVRDVRKRDVLNWSAVLLVGVVHVMVVYPIKAFGSSHESLWAYMGHSDLPRATYWAIHYSTSSIPHVVGGVLAVLSITGLGYVMVGGNGRHHLPFLVSMAWVAVLMHVLAVWAGVSLPFARMMFTMGVP